MLADPPQPVTQKQLQLNVNIHHADKQTALRTIMDPGAEANLVSKTLVKFLGATPSGNFSGNLSALGRNNKLGSKPEIFNLLVGNAHMGYSPETTPFLCLDDSQMGDHDMILGLPWFCQIDPRVEWAERKIAFAGTDRKRLFDPHLPPQSKPSFISADELAVLEEDDDIVSVSVMMASATHSGIDISPPKLPEQYAEFKDVFSKKGSENLPPHRQWDHEIVLESGTKVPFGPIYNLSEMELKVLKDYLDRNLENGFIRYSTSPAGAPILFVKKKDGSLRLCVDYRGLNAVSIKNRTPLPLISNTFDRLQGANYYTKLDLRDAYNLIRIREGDEWKTAFRTRYGHFEYMVMPFGLANAPATFQTYINQALSSVVDICCVVYLDDILIYSKTLEDHDRDVKRVLTLLRKHRLYAKMEKCQFSVQKVEFLGFIITPEGISMDPERITTVLNWPVPKTIKQLQSFLGFANFYRRFIYGYSKMSAPLTKLIKGQPKHLAWNPQAQTALDELKKAFTKGPLLRHFDPALRIVLFTDASDYAVSGIITQEFEGQYHPIAFHSRKLIAAELNYDTPEKEMLAIVDCFKHWRHYLEGARQTITLRTDHKNHESFFSKKTLSRRQARWAELLSGYDVRIDYQPGKTNPADGPSRRPDYRLLKPQVAAVEVEEDTDQTLWSDLAAATATCPQMQTVAAHATQDQSEDQKPDWQLENGVLLFQNRIFVPTDALRLRVIRLHHDSPMAGHMGTERTLELLSRNFYWGKMSQWVKRYVTSCEVCARSKKSRHKPHGELNSLPVPDSKWQSVTMDFVTDLPLSTVNRYDAILVVVDRLTKMSHYVPCHKNTTAEQLAKLILTEVIRYHGIPESYISDRGTQFKSKFWTELCRLQGTSRRLSTAYHPQTDGQTERQNQTMEQYLRAYVNYQQDDWVDFLPLAEFAYNNSVHATTGMTPFFANYGRHPRFAATSLPKAHQESQSPAAELFKKQMDKVTEILQDRISKASNYQAGYYNQKHEPVTYAVGDQVYLRTDNIKTKRVCRKLDHTKIGPYTILDRVGLQAYRLDLPSNVNIHNVFHISYLEPYRKNDIPGRVKEPPPTIEVDGEFEYYVEEILDSKVRKNSPNSFRYLVKWQGYDNPIDYTWEPVEHLIESLDAIADFHAKYPNKPRPKS